MRFSAGRSGREGPVRDAASVNRTVLLTVARRIKPLLEDVVFVGGQVTELLVTSRGVTRVRPTTDVDIVVRASTRLRYREVEDRLSRLGLKNDVREGAPICRWITPEDFVLDVMPDSSEVLGFANPWYGAALAHAAPFDLGEGLVILIPSAPVFLATKWEAFANRGNHDLLASHDLEDVISVLAGRAEVVTEVAASPQPLRSYLARQAREFLAEADAGYAVQGALPDAERTPGLAARTLKRMGELANLDER
jgi:predicted nucleotidyltransferase